MIRNIYDRFSVVEGNLPGQAGESQCGFVKWMFQHYPRIAGRYQEPANPANHNRLNNWREYVVNFNNYAETRN